MADRAEFAISGAAGAPALSEIACYRASIPSSGGPYAMSGGRRYDEFVTTIVKVTARDGTYGLGEASTLGSDYLDGFAGSTQATVRELAPTVLTCDPMQANVLVRAMDAAVLGHYPGKAAIDIAMWDLRAKLLGVPVGELLGGIAETSLHAFAAVRVGTLDAMTEEAQTLAARGYKRWQVKVGDDPLEDAGRLRAVVDIIGKDREYLACDANRGWTTAQALRFVREIADIDTYIEQPCASVAELAQVREHCSNPIIIDEGAKQPRDLLDAIALGCVNGVNIKPVRVGGLTKAAAMRDIAEAAGLMIIVDDPQGGELSGAALAQLGATVDPRHLLAVSFFGSLDDPGPTAAQPQVLRRPRFQNGRGDVPLVPGLGAFVDSGSLGDPLFVVHP
jgi:cis-L-3-hydroxyproline dehydratase